MLEDAIKFVRSLVEQLLSSVVQIRMNDQIAPIRKATLEALLDLESGDLKQICEATAPKSKSEILPLLTAVCQRLDDSLPDLSKAAVNSLHHLLKIGLQSESKECIRHISSCFDLYKQQLLSRVSGSSHQDPALLVKCVQILQ